VSEASKLLTGDRLGDELEVAVRGEVYRPRLPRKQLLGEARDLDGIFERRAAITPARIPFGNPEGSASRLVA